MKKASCLHMLMLIDTSDGRVKTGCVLVEFTVGFIGDPPQKN